MKIKCAIVDDEFLARKLLKDYVSKVPNLELVGDYDSPLKVSELIFQGHIDLLFLDIQMPDITGLEFLRSLDKQPAVIFTTAYKEFAMEGYELNIIDYLLKPFSFDRFLKAVMKAINIVSTQQPKNLQAIEEDNYHENYIIIRADRKHYKINYEDLIFIEGQKAYVTFHSVGNKKITALASLKVLEEKLPANQFIRIHKSYIVSIKKIRFLEGNLLEIADQNLPIGKNYKQMVNKVFGLNE